MSNAASFMGQYVNKIQQLVEMMEDLRAFNDMATQDTTLFSRYFASPDPRTDITEADADNAHAAIVQMLFTYDSGSPTQKSFLFKMLP